MMNVMINNLSETATHRRWIVCRAVDGEVWFYAAWYYDQEVEARAQAREVGGFVVDNTTWLDGCFGSKKS